RSRSALSSLAGLDAIADIGIAARLSVHHIGMRAPARRLAGVGGADLAEIGSAWCRGRGQVYEAVIDVTEIGVGAVGVERAAPGKRLVVTARRRVARQVGGAVVVVVAIQRRSGSALSSLAGLDAVTHVGIAARTAVHHVVVHAAGGRIAGVGGADLAVIAVYRIAGTRAAHAAVVLRAEDGVCAGGVGRAAAGKRLVGTARGW